MVESPESAVFPNRMCDPKGTSAHTPTQSTRPLLLSCTHTYTRAIKSNGVCPVAGRESPLMSGSHNDIIAVDGACWGILFHTIGMLQTSSHSTHWWWWQKLVLTPDLLVDVFDKKPQRADSSLRQENCCYFQQELWWCCFFSFNKDRHRGPLSKRLWCVITLSFWNSRQTTLSFTRSYLT